MHPPPFIKTSIINNMKRTRQVSFSTKKDEREIERNTTKENALCWYSELDMTKMRINVRTEATACRKILEIYGFNSQSLDKFTPSILEPFPRCNVDKLLSVLSKLQSCFRGLEPMILSEISRDKSTYILTVLRYQQKEEYLLLKTAELHVDNLNHIDFITMKENLSIRRIGKVSKQLSKWSMYKARALARYDANDVYCSIRRKQCKTYLEIKHAAALFEDNDADTGKRKQNAEDKFNSRMMRTKISLWA